MLLMFQSRIMRFPLHPSTAGMRCLRISEIDGINTAYQDIVDVIAMTMMLDCIFVITFIPSEIIFDCFLYGYSYRLHCLRSAFCLHILYQLSRLVLSQLLQTELQTLTSSLTSYFVIENWY